MAAENYFGDTMTVAVETEDASPVTIPVGSAKQVQAIATKEHVRLDSADSILREAIAGRAFNVDVIIGVAAFDATFAQEWLGGDGTAASTPTDDNSVATFELTATATGDAGTTHTVVIDGIAFPSLPLLDMQEGQWVVHNYQGDGRLATLS